MHSSHFRTPLDLISAEMAAAAAAAKKADADPLAKQFAKLAGKAKPGKAMRKPAELKKRHSASTLSMPSLGEGRPEGWLLTVQSWDLA